jgi:hypothetical protein
MALSETSIHTEYHKETKNNQTSKQKKFHNLVSYKK